MAVVEPRPGLSDKVGVCITDDARVSYGGGYTGCTYAGMHVCGEMGEWADKTAAGKL